MPTVAIIAGVKIQFYPDEHPPPHFHARIAEFVAQPLESTGRFAGATGGWIMYAETEPFVLGSADPVEYSWEGEGELTFAKAE